MKIIENNKTISDDEDCLNLDAKKTQLSKFDFKEDYKAEAANICSDLKSLHEKLIQTLFESARDKSDVHFAYRKKLQADKEAPARFATKVTMRNGSITCAWYYNGYLGGREEGSYFEPVAKTRGSRYRKSVFREANDEELVIILDVEAHYVWVMESLKVIKKQGREIDKLLRGFDYEAGEV